EAEVETRVARCPGCGAELELGGLVTATTCPFCDTPIQPGADVHRAIRPQAVLPFSVPERDARNAMVAWLGRLWFAPNGLQEYARKGRMLTGIYVPFWTFDAATRSRYRGQRGDAYYETRTVTVQENGRSVRRQEQVRRVRWTPVSGWVSRRFDDVLVIGSTSLPQADTEALAPWDLAGLQPVRPDYLSGFQAEAYSVPLDAGHATARARMEAVIAADVRAAIGGDEQRIDRIDTDWSEETFKHILLPVWTAAYRYGGRAWRFVVNGQTGKVRGERPWSVWKIALAVMAAAIVIGVGAWLGQQAQ
ncbi:MAG: primosomal protein N' (replication factor Y) - superfamily II helicase, partial [Gemmobacter sp.]